jgi:DNA (cytosine-5)-methyltransferase 1
MGFRDGEIDFAGQSYQQLCKRAANGWDVNLASLIFKRIFEQHKASEVDKKQLATQLV